MRLTLTRRAFSAGALGAASAWRLRAGQTNMFKLGIITDELTGQLEDALPFLTNYRRRWCEWRDMWDRNILNRSKEGLDRARSLIEHAGLRVSDSGSPIFKWNLPQMPAKPGEKRDE